jgi:N utilization substance protein A
MNQLALDELVKVYGLDPQEVKERIDSAMRPFHSEAMRKQAVLDEIKTIEGEQRLKYFEKVKNTLVEGKNVQNFGETSAYFVRLKGFDKEAILPAYEAMSTDHFKHNDVIKALVMPTLADTIVLSRTHPLFLELLIKETVPEVARGKIEIVKIVREPAKRSKVAIKPLTDTVNALGSVIGRNLSRIKKIREEINGEEVDLIEYSDDPAVYVKNALAPARILDVTMTDEKSCEVKVSAYQLSLAIGPGGQNVRLAARLTGIKIDIKA